MNKQRLSFWQIWNMSFGFMGIQFGWALQMANMSSIYEFLGAKSGEIPLLWLAAPLTGFIVQPIIGYLSDRTWHPTFGRRRPYFMIGAILSSIALVLMPNCSELWMAAGLLWILDSSINISMEPFRAFVADNLPEEQRTFGFSMQSLFIGLGSVVASALPWIFTNWVGMKDEVGHVGIPSNVKWSFYIGACAFFLFVLYTVVTSKEYPPVEDKKRDEKKKVGVKEGLNEIIEAILNMPKRMKQLALVQFLTWPGLFLMWFYYTPAVGADIFGGSASDTSDPALRTLYQQGTELAGLTYSFQNLITFLFAMLLPVLAKPLGQKFTHQLCLTVGGLGLISLSLIHGAQNQVFFFAVMGAVGIAWASILSMPYAMLADCLPENKIGVYMGIFNFFIVLPEIIAALSFGWVMDTFLDNNRVLAVSIGGGLLILAGILTMRISETKNS
ncbi:MAG: MFS transporter [Flavobacteriales bacterium]|nr:MFS transporter [Flavobacteriales bacterium]